MDTLSIDRVSTSSRKSIRSLAGIRCSSRKRNKRGFQPQNIVVIAGHKSNTSTEHVKMPEGESLSQKIQQFLMHHGVNVLHRMMGLLYDRVTLFWAWCM